jgi:hypothetical protein
LLDAASFVVQAIVALLEAIDVAIAEMTGGVISGVDDPTIVPEPLGKLLFDVVMVDVDVSVEDSPVTVTRPESLIDALPWLAFAAQVKLLS